MVSGTAADVITTARLDRSADVEWNPCTLFNITADFFSKAEDHVCVLPRSKHCSQQDRMLIDLVLEQKCNYSFVLLRWYRHNPCKSWLAKPCQSALNWGEGGSRFCNWSHTDQRELTEGEYSYRNIIGLCLSSEQASGRKMSCKDSSFFVIYKLMRCELHHVELLKYLYELFKTMWFLLLACYPFVPSAT